MLGPVVEQEPTESGVEALPAYAGWYVILFLAGPFYETIFHGSDSGQTPGKRLLGIRIRGEDGAG